MLTRKPKYVLTKIQLQKQTILELKKDALWHQNIEHLQPPTQHFINYVSIQTKSSHVIAKVKLIQLQIDQKISQNTTQVPQNFQRITHKNKHKVVFKNILRRHNKIKFKAKSFINIVFIKTILQQHKRGLQHQKEHLISNRILYKQSNLIIDNIKFFKFADATYTSYWFGRLINMFIIQGKKKKIIKQMHNIMLMLKFKYQAMPLLLLYELLEKLKPVFLLRKYKIRRTQIVEYPYVAKNSKRYMKALQWLRREIEFNKKSGFQESISTIVYNKLSAIKENFSKHTLLKTRDIHNSYSNMSQFNIRYNWKRNKKW